MSNSNTDTEREFFDAVGGGDTAQVRAMVKSQPDLLLAFDYECFGATPLTRVCFHNDREMVVVLIELGADVNRRSDWEMGPWSPMHCAISGRHSELAELLIEHGAELDVHSAAGTGRSSDLKRLLESDPRRVSELGGDGCQPLHFADSCEVAEILLSYDADIEARCMDHYSTPVQYLAYQRAEVARFLFSRGATADVFSAVLAGDTSLLNRLIAADRTALTARINQETFPPGPDVDAHNILTFFVGENTTPMHAAALANRPEMVELLASHGESPNVRGGYDDATPLHVAAWHDHPDVAQALIKAGADIDAKSGEIHNNTAAGWAIVAGSDAIFSLLLSQGAVMMDWYRNDAEAGLKGEFRAYKCVPLENYERILQRLDAESE